MSSSSLPPMPFWLRAAASLIRRLPRGRYALMNLICKSSIVPFISPLRATTGRLSFICDVRDGYARETAFMGWYEPQETVVFRQLLRTGDCVVDVGANWGYFTLLAADLVGSGGRVIALEPHPDLFRQLRTNVALNHLGQVTCLQLAASDHDGELPFLTYPEAALNRGTSRLANPGESATTIHVKARPLLGILDDERVTRIDLLKLDIEGAEAVVVPTIRSALVEHRIRRVLIELHPLNFLAFGVDPRSLIQIFIENNYSAWRIDHRPEVFRRAAYRLPISLAEVLKPLAPGDALDEWPHLLFSAPGEDLDPRLSEGR